MFTEKIDRNKFLKNMGLKGAALFAVYCSGISCLPSDVSPANDVLAGGVLTLDLNDPANAELKSVGAYIINNAIVVANTTNGYVAVTQICSHENKRKVIFRDNEFYCTDHGARFDLSGKGLNKDGSKGIKVYSVSQSGNILTVS